MAVCEISLLFKSLQYMGKIKSIHETAKSEHKVMNFH